MNYSVFKLQNQGGRPGIFWEKESIPKNDRKFGYKKKNQRFPIRRFAGDTHISETDLVSLTPEEPPLPPPKPQKNFIKRNKEKLAGKGKPEAPSTVTLTQEQLNAILRSVDKKNDTNEILVESPRRKKDTTYQDEDDDNEEFEERREKKRNKKRQEPEDNESAGGGSIYALLGNKSKPKNTSDNESVNSDESLREERRRKPHKQRRERQSRRNYDDDDDDEPELKTNKSRSRKAYNNDDDDLDDELDNRKRRTRSKNTKKYQSDDEDEINESRSRRNRSKPKYYDDYDEEIDIDKENRKKTNKRTKRREDSYDDDNDNREHERRERTKKRDKSRRDNHSVEKRDRSEKRDVDVHNSSLNKTDEENVSPRDKIGLPVDLSWRHMSKAERKRLEMARQKHIDEEEKREEERIRQLQAKYGGISSETVSQSPPKRIATRSDPVTRLDRGDRGRETDLSTRTDHYRRDRRSMSPSENRSPDRSPEVPYNQTVDTSPKVVPVPKRHLTLAERKRLEWEREKVESQIREQEEYQPWGKPGAGAPLRTRSGHVAAEYRGRQDQMKSIAIEEEREDDTRESETQYQPHPPKEKKKTRHHSPPPQQPVRAKPETEPLPHAMRSSFVLGEAAPDYDKFNETKEKERKQWLADLEKQIEEKKAKEFKYAENNKVADTWADKLGLSHRPAQFPEQPKSVPVSDTYGQMEASAPYQDTHRTSSAPGEGNIEDQTYIRGQNAPIDPITKKELEEKRRKYLEHQTAVKAQVEEKERQKRMERDRKMREDMEEERKLQAERELLQKQFESEQQKMRQKEAQRQAQVNQLKAAMDEAHAKALQEKYQRKMQHLEAGGHDTTKLREHLEGIAGAITKITPRSDPPHTGVQSNAPTHIPGLDLSTARTHQPQFTETKREPEHDPYVEDRVLTPSRFRHPSKPWSDPSSPRREFGTQTGNQNESATELDVDDVRNLLNTSLPREESEVQIEYRMDKKVRVVSAPKEMMKKRSSEKRAPRSKDQSPQYREQPSPHQHHHEVQKRRELIEQEKRKRLEEIRRKGPVKPGSRPKWGYKNMDNKKPVKNSERDPFFEQKKRESQFRRYQREQKLLAMVEANKQVIPKYFVPPSKSRDPSPYSDFEHDSIRQTHVSRRSKSHSPNRTLSNDRSDYLRVYDDFPQQTKSVNSRRKTSRSPTRDRSESPPPRQSRARHKSPPVPAIKHRNEVNQNYAGGSESRRKGGKYADGDPLDVPLQNGDFVPFTRTLDVLDPAKADEPLPLSREATAVANARKQYYENLNPEKYGNRQATYQDADRIPTDSKDPLMNPGLVLDYPTSRQDQILIQLSTLKQSLMQRQRELETFSPSDLENQDIPVSVSG